MSQSKLYYKYRASVPNPVRQRKFEALKPWYVRALRVRDRQVCMCRYHVNFGMVCVALARVRRKSPALPQPGHLGSAWAEMCCCPPPAGEVHPAPACVNGRCSLCGPEKVVFSETERQGKTLVTWNTYAPAPHTTVDRHGTEVTVERLQLIKKQTTTAELVAEFLRQAKKYVQHRFEKAWQRSVFKNALQNLTPGSILVWMDFSENLALQHNLEPQSMHWIHVQVSVLCCVCWVMVEVGGDQWERQKMYHYFLSDDKTHDAVFVGHCRRLLLNFYQQREGGGGVKRMVQFSDGAACQFKCAAAMYDASALAEEHGIAVFLNWFATGHGHGEPDSSGQIMKTAISLENVRGEGEGAGTGGGLCSAGEVHKWAIANLEQPEHTKSDWKPRSDLAASKFWLIEPGELAKEIAQVPTIPGTLRIHQCITRTKGVVYTRESGCMCFGCVAGTYTECENPVYSGEPRRTEVEPRDKVARSVTRQARVEQGLSLVALCSVGDVVAVACEDEDYSYYLARVEKGPYTVGRGGEVGAYEIEVEQGAVVFSGLFFSRVGEAERHRYVCDPPEKRVPLYVNLVRYAPVHLLSRGRGRNQTWQVVEDEHEAIMAML